MTLILVILLFLWGLVILFYWRWAGRERRLVETDSEMKSCKQLTFTSLTTCFTPAVWWETFVTNILGEIWILTKAQISIVCLRHSYSCHTGDAYPHPAGLTWQIKPSQVTCLWKRWHLTVKTRMSHVRGSTLDLIKVVKPSDVIGTVWDH